MYTQGKFVSRASWRVEFPAQRPRPSFSTATGHYTQNPRQRSMSIMAMFSPVIRSRLQQTVLFAQSEKITIKASSRQGKNGEVVFLEADLAGRTVDLTCLEPHSDCKVLRRGEYEMLRLVRNEGCGAQIFRPTSELIENAACPAW